jgi:signal transduction histidine kinase
MIVSVITNITIAIVAIALGALVLCGEPKSATYQSFFLFAAGVALSATAKPFFRQGDSFLAVLFVWWGCELAVLGAFSMVRVSSDGHLNSRFIWSLVPWLLLFILTPMLLVVASFYKNPAIFFEQAYHISLPFFATVMGAYLIASIFLCLRRNINTFGLPSLLARGLVLVVILSASAICVADLILPVFNVCIFASASNFFALTILIIGGYVMIRYGVGNNSLFLRKGISYFLSLISVALLFFGVEFCIEKFLYQNDEIVDVISAVVGALAFSPFRDFFDKFTDRLFFRNSYHFLSAVRELGERLSAPLDHKALLATITDFLRLIIKPTETVFFAAEESEAGRVALISGLIANSAVTADYSALAAFFLEHGHDEMIIADATRLFRISRSSQKENSCELIKERAARLGIAALVPVSAQGRIKMIMMIGYKSSGALLSKDDGELLDFVARRAAIALENFELRDLMDRQTERFEERVSVRAARLKSMYESQSKFLVDVSHEFKTPLAILKMNAGVFADSEDAEQKRAWYVMDTTLDRLSRLVGNILDAARSGLPGDGSCKKSIVVKELLQDALDDCAILAEDKGVGLFLSSNEISVFGEWDKLKEVMLNLLSNALQHTLAGGSIFLTAHESDGEAEIVVRDTGSGISRENLPHIFERFYRIGEGGFAGTGIGLYLCRQIIEGHKGTITAESQEGKGSCFVIRLPLFADDP